MKILHIIPTLSKVAGGPTEVAINLVKELNKLDCSAEILTTNDDGSNLFFVKKFGELTEFREVPVRFFPREYVRLKEFIPSFSAINWISKNLNNYDILDIHYLFSFVPLFTRRLARKRNFPYTVRTMGQLSSWALKQSSLKKKVFFSWQEYNNLREADALHSTSKGEERDIRNFGLLNTSVINLPLGVEKPVINSYASQLLRQEFHLDEKTFVLLFLSRLHYKKQPEIFIDIISRLKDKYNVHGILAGSGTTEYEEILKEKVSKLGLNKVITFTGFVEGEEKKKLLQGSDLFVLPSYSENFAIAVAESLASETPVVITPEVQISEYVREYNAGAIVENSKEDFIKKISELIDNKDILSEYKSNGKRLVEEKFNWTSIAQQLLKEYERILQKRKTVSG